MTKLEKFISKIILLSSPAFPWIVSEKMVVAIIFLLCNLNAFLNRLRKLFKEGNYSRKYGNLLTERFSIFEIKFRSYRSLCYSTAEHILRVSWAGGKMRSFTTFADYTLSQSHIDCRHHTQSLKNQILFTFLLTGGHKVSKIWFSLWWDFRFILLLFFLDFVFLPTFMTF